MDEVDSKSNDATGQGSDSTARVHAQTGGVIMHADKRILNFRK